MADAPPAAHIPETESLASPGALDIPKDGSLHRVVSIRWAKYTNKCFDIGHSSLQLGKAGMGLHIWDCPPDPHERDKFIVPIPGHFGPIRPVRFPDMCLQTQDGWNLDFQPCVGVPKAQMLWTIRTGGTHGNHHVHLASDDGKCLDVPNDDSSNGNWVQLWKCSQDYPSGSDGGHLNYKGVDYWGPSADHPEVTAEDRVGDEELLIEPAPVDCAWGTWSSWSSCSQVCGEGHQTRYRAIDHAPAYGGLDCAGDWSEVQGCGYQRCRTTTAQPVYRSPLLWAASACLLLCCCLPPLVLCCRRARQRETMRRKEEDEANMRLLEQLKIAEELQRRDDEELQRRREEEAWKRTEVQRRAREDNQRRSREEQLRRAAEAKQRRLREASAQTEVVTCPARHALRPPRRPERSWVCDGRLAEGGCRSGIREIGNHAVSRYRCEVCNFDFCIECYQARQAGRFGAGAPGPETPGGVPPTPSRPQASTGRTPSPEQAARGRTPSPEQAGRSSWRGRGVTSQQAVGILPGQDTVLYQVPDIAASEWRVEFDGSWGPQLDARTVAPQRRWGPSPGGADASDGVPPGTWTL